MIIIQILGIISAVIILVYILLGILYKLFSRKLKAKFDESKMPVLRPIPIATKNRNFFMGILVWLFDVRNFKLEENWYFTLNDGTKIVVHKGFIFDGASIPRLFWTILSPIGLLLVPGLIHDYGYRYLRLWKIENGKVVPFMKHVHKHEWDRLFREVGNQVNGMKLINYIAWFCLIIGGCFAWKSNRRRKKELIIPELVNK